MSDSVSCETPTTSILMTAAERELFGEMVRHYVKHPSKCLYDHDRQWPLLLSLKGKLALSPWTKLCDALPPIGEDLWIAIDDHVFKGSYNPWPEDPDIPDWTDDTGCRLPVPTHWQLYVVPAPPIEAASAKNL